MANPTTFGSQPTVPVVLQLPLNQLPQPTAVPQPQQQPAAVTQPQPSEQPSKKPSLPKAHYYVFPWKQ